MRAAGGNGGGRDAGSSVRHFAEWGVLSVSGTTGGQVASQTVVTQDGGFAAAGAARERGWGPGLSTHRATPPRIVRFLSEPHPVLRSVYFQLWGGSLQWCSYLRYTPEPATVQSKGALPHRASLQTLVLLPRVLPTFELNTPLPRELSRSTCFCRL